MPTDSDDSMRQPIILASAVSIVCALIDTMTLPVMPTACLATTLARYVTGALRPTAESAAASPREHSTLQHQSVSAKAVTTMTVLTSYA